MNYELVGGGGWGWKLTGLYINSFVSNTIALPLNRIINRKKKIRIERRARKKKIKLEKEKEKEKERKNEPTKGRNRNITIG